MVAGGIVEPGGIDHAKAQIGESRFALAAIAGNARMIVDKGQASPDQSVEQR